MSGRSIMKPRVFIASSVEGLGLAYFVQESLEYDADCTVWNQGAFTPSAYPMEDLVEALDNSDFGVFIFSPDDLVLSRRDVNNAVRDNVILELGLFIGRLGRKRTFMVQPRDKDLHTPSDLVGLKPVTFPDRADGNLKAAIGPACNEIRTAIKKIGPIAQTVEQVVAELDDKAVAILRAFGSVPYFARPDRLDFANQIFDDGVNRLRKLKTLTFEVSDDGKFYAYHWTDLGRAVVSHFGFDKGVIPAPSSAVAGTVQSHPVDALSPEEKHILTEAAKHDGIVARIKGHTGTFVKSRKSVFGNPEDARDRAKWVAAFDRLVDAELFEDNGKGSVFEMTDKGYTWADAVEKNG